MDEKVMIGDCLGTIEEFMPGEGTFAQDGKIFASKIGKKVIDLEKHEAKVIGKDIPRIGIGQTVFGDVVMMKPSMAIVNVQKIVGTEGIIDERTTIFVSNIDDKYVENPNDMFGIGDIIKAKVFKMEGNMIDLSTKGDLGVVKAFCKRCRMPLIRSEKYEDKLECGSCKHVEKRKIAADYGKVNDY